MRCCRSSTRWTSARAYEVGRELARLPLDPRVARMLVAARDEGSRAGPDRRGGALGPGPARAAAGEGGSGRRAPRPLADERSDFLAFLKLWKLQAEPGLRRLCRENPVLSAHARMARCPRQLEATLAELKWPRSSVNPEKDYRDPSRAARGPARQHRHARRRPTVATPARAGSSSGSSGAPGRASRASGGRGGARRDDAALRPLRRGHRPEMARGARRAPHPARAPEPAGTGDAAR